MPTSDAGAIGKAAVSSGGYAPGETATFDLRIKNDGLLPVEGMRIAVDNAEPISGEGFIVDGSGITVGELPKGSSLTIQLAHTVTQAELGEGSFRVRAEATYEGGTTGAESAPVPLQEPIWALDLKLELINEGTGTDGAFRPGEEAQGTLTITNTGNMDADELAIEMLPEGVTLIDPDAGPWWDLITRGRITHTAEEAAAGTVHYEVEGVGDFQLAGVNGDKLSFVSTQILAMKTMAPSTTGSGFTATQVAAYIRSLKPPKELVSCAEKGMEADTMFDVPDQKDITDGVYQLFTSASNRIKYFGASASAWWVRSVSTGIGTSYYVTAAGAIASMSTMSAATRSYGAVPMFRIIQGSAK